MEIKYGKIMKNIRESEADSLRDAGQNIGISKSSYNSFESQVRIIPIERLVSFCDYYRVSVDYVLDLTKRKKYDDSKTGYDPELIVKRLAEFKVEHNNISLGALSIAIDIPKQTIYTYTTGEQLASTKFIYHLCYKYKISADYILGRTNSPKCLK